jgi:heat shock protein HslJ
MFGFGKMVYGLIIILVLASLACAAQVPLLQVSSGRLEGTQWELNSYGPQGSEIAVADGAKITMAFTGADKMGGTDGCHIFGGNYEIRAGSVNFHNLESKMVNCRNQNLADQELEYLHALSETDRYEIRGNQLILWYGDGQYTLIFTRSRPPGLVGANLDNG